MVELMENANATTPATPRMTREECLKLSMEERAALPAAVKGALMVASLVENLNAQTREQPEPPA